ncbi:hypothetical protein AM588_10006843 [Phytophthora nicotianae]|uniref:Uncharacterized protein n=1 Tax=Phytophthora nicotianae TaxID=4792 RepID=A0A0W8DHD4_PHYNI|nr:hypothetical protein AM588_10006843 [Phytophthora nicotianae]
MRRSIRVAAIAAWVAAVVTDNVETATTCTVTAATVSKYTASTTFAAAQIEYADCSTKVVRVVTASDGAAQLDLSSKQIVMVKSLPSITQLYVAFSAPLAG